MKKVTIYSTPNCHFCHMAKDFFAANGVAFTDYNVSENMEKRKEMIDMTGQMGVPVIMIEEEGQEPDLMVGFSQDLVAKKLDITAVT
jgi:glutaredoxin